MKAISISITKMKRYQTKEKSLSKKVHELETRLNQDKGTSRFGTGKLFSNIDMAEDAHNESQDMSIVRFEHNQSRTEVSHSKHSSIGKPEEFKTVPK